jgi:hypothetical protein
MTKKYRFDLAEKHGTLEYFKSLAIEERIREKYSISDEFALHRQRDRKPEDFAEYDAFVEQVKAEVNAEIERQREEHSKY